MIKRIKDVLRGEHFRYLNGLYRRTDVGYIFIEGYEAHQRPMPEDAVKVVSPYNWREE